MDNFLYLVLSLFLVIFLLMWVRERNHATKELLSHNETRSSLEKAHRNLESLATANLADCHTYQALAAANLEIPVLADCMLHGRFKGFAAKVTISRNGELGAPDRIEDRVLFRCEKGFVLGAPQWAALTSPIKYGKGYWADYLMVLNMLGAPYIMKRDDYNDLQAQK